MTLDPRSIREEREFLDRLESFADVDELRQVLLDAGHSPAIANGLCSWLVAKKVGRRDDSSDRTRARYRRILRELMAPAGRGPKGGERLAAHNPRFRRRRRYVKPATAGSTMSAPSTIAA